MNLIVTGATGYVGGRLIPRLLDRGHHVWALARQAPYLMGRHWSTHENLHIIEGDLKTPDSLPELQDTIHAAYYLVHSMHAGKDFDTRDQELAQNFIEWVRPHRPHVIYLGGLTPPSDQISKHLRSRADVGRLLRKSMLTTEFQAGPVIGSGSASFEMVRYLTERLPAMIAPKWIMNEVQTISIRDVLTYLVAALEKDPQGIIEIGSDVLTFRDMMQIYGEEQGLTRVIIPIPVLAPTLAALWVGLVTPISNRLAVPLVQGVIHPVLADTKKAQDVFPEVHPATYRTAVKRAVAKTGSNDIETRWSGALTSKPYEIIDWEGMIREVRRRPVNASAEEVFSTVSSLGGDNGWLVWEWAWECRGFLDQLVGGPGLRRGRRHPSELQAGEALDFWRVETVIPSKLLRLRAEMKVPGQAWLQFDIDTENGMTFLTQTAFFRPYSLPGFIYWWGLYPIHTIIFSDMINALVCDAEARSVLTSP
ncbi:MAG: DUF2867 domain-containing protein [Verrucomicrobiota bacterium]